MSNKNYRKISEKAMKAEEVVEPIVSEEETCDVVEETSEIVCVPNHTKIGKVVNCDKLNVRRNPNTDASIVCIINRLTEVEIDESLSTDTFYKVYLATGVEGYCMKEYISVND